MSELPPHDQLHRHCQALWESGQRIRAWMPWDDYTLKPNKFPLMTPLHGGREYFNIPNLQRLLAEAEEMLPGKVGSAAVSVRREIFSIQSWIRQLEGESLPDGTGEGYAAWVAYLRGVEAPERKSA